MKELLRKYIEENFEELPMFLSDMAECEISVPSPKIGLFKRAKKESARAFECSPNIEEFIEENKSLNDFQTLLFKLIDDRKLKDSDVYNKVHLDRRLFSKIRNDSMYHPSKDTVILLGISLELSEKELESLLESASYSLPKNNYFDLIIRFCFINKIFDINKINDFLEEYDCRLFSI